MELLSRSELKIYILTQNKEKEEKEKKNKKDNLLKVITDHLKYL